MRRTFLLSLALVGGLCVGIAAGIPSGVKVTSLTLTVGQQFSGTVATYTESDSSIADARQIAHIGWGDGAVDQGTVARSCDPCSPQVYGVAGAHTFTAPGVYTTSVTVTDPITTATGSAVATVMTAPAATTPTTTTPTPSARPVPRPKPAAGLVTKLVQPATLRVGKKAKLSFQLTLPPGRKLAYVLWRFGDKKDKRVKLAKGVYTSAAAATRGTTLTYKPKKRGKTLVHITAVDDRGGATDVAGKLVVLAPKATPPADDPPAIDVYTTEDHVVDGSLVHAQIVALASGCCDDQSPTSGAIDWGDGASSDIPDGTAGADHTYAGPGHYVVTATFSNPNGDAAPATTAVDVDPDPYALPAICGDFTVAGVGASSGDTCLQPINDGSPQDAYLADHAFALGGMLVTNPTGQILVQPKTGVVAPWPLGQGTLTIGPVGMPALDSPGFKVPPTKTHDSTDIVFVPFDPAYTLPNGLVLDSKGVMHFRHQGEGDMEIDFSAALPPPLSSTISLTLDSGGNLNGLEGSGVGGGGGGGGGGGSSFTINVPDMDLGPVTLHDVTITNDANGTSGAGDIDLLDGTVHVTFALAPGGGLTSASLAYDGEIPIQPELAIKGISASLTADPFQFTGTIGLITSGPLELFGHPLLRVDGCFDFIVVKKGQTIGLCPDKANTYTEPYDQEIIFYAHGEATLIDLFKVATGAIGVRTGGGEGTVVAMAVNADLKLPSDSVNVIEVYGNASGIFKSLSAWQFDVSMGVCLLDLACTGESIVFSSLGISGCYGPAGGYYLWSGDWDASVGGCAWHDYGDEAKIRALGPDAFAAANQATVKLGSGGQSLRIRGTGGAPRVTLTGPDGTTITDDGSGRADADVVIMHSEAKDVMRRGHLEHMTGKNETFIVLNHAKAGTWTVRTQPGSVPIESIAKASKLAPPAALVRVTGTGLRRTLHYRITHPVAGRTYQFGETGPHGRTVIGKANGRAGTIRFTPALDRPGRRTIDALIAYKGIPNRSVKLGSYLAPAVPPPGAPRVALSAKGSQLRVAWSAVTGAKTYIVRARLRDGRVLTFSRGGRAHSLQISRYGVRDGATVSVTAIAADQRRGHAGRAKIAPRKRGAPVLVL